MADPNLADRDRRVLELRRAGATLAAIGDQLGMPISTVHDAYRRAMAAEPPTEAAEARAGELDRLDRLQTAVWASAMRGDLGAVATVLKISERRARLLGLDGASAAPAPEVKAEVSPVDDLAARRAGRRAAAAPS